MACDVKICGLTRAEDVALAIACGAHYLGFIVEAESTRRLTAAQAAQLALPAKGLAKRVAVTVNADDALLERITEHMQPDYIQCHGDESPKRVAEVARKFKLGTIKAIPIASETDLKTAEEYVGVSDFILYDAKPPKGSKVRGGHGLKIDWTLIARAPRPKIFALAGGLTAGTVAQAISLTKAPIVDVSSGVEAQAGVKDAKMMKAFMNAVRQA